MKARASVTDVIKGIEPLFKLKGPIPIGKHYFENFSMFAGLVATVHPTWVDCIRFSLWNLIDCYGEFEKTRLCPTKEDIKSLLCELGEPDWPNCGTYVYHTKNTSFAKLVSIAERPMAKDSYDESWYDSLGIVRCPENTLNENKIWWMPWPLVRTCFGLPCETLISITEVLKNPQNRYNADERTEIMHKQLNNALSSYMKEESCGGLYCGRVVL